MLVGNGFYIDTKLTKHLFTLDVQPPYIHLLFQKISGGPNLATFKRATTCLQVHQQYITVSVLVKSPFFFKLHIYTRMS